MSGCGACVKREDSTTKAVNSLIAFLKEAAGEGRHFCCEGGRESRVKGDTFVVREGGKVENQCHKCKFNTSKGIKDSLWMPFNDLIKG